MLKSLPKKITQRICLLSLLVVVLLGSVVLLSGCQSTDQYECYLDTGNIKQATFEYDSSNNRTKVQWSATLTNDTIYNINGFSVDFAMYSNDELLTTKTWHYDKVQVKHGATYTGNFYFYADGEVDAIKYVSWTANHVSFWDTYKVWLIATIVVAIILASIYIIVMIVQDLDLDDTWDAITEFCEEYLWVPICLGIPLIGGGIAGFVTSNWVPVLITLGSMVAVVLVALLAHLIKFITENCLVGGRGSIIDNDTEEYDDEFDNENDEECDEEDKDEFDKIPTKSKNVISKAQRTKTTFADIAGLDEAKNAFYEKVVNAFKHRELYAKYGKKVGGGILLYGLPGTGKTMFAEAASNATDSLFIPVKCSDIKSKWYGESENKVKKIFDKARRAKKAIIFFDEFEAIGAKRTDDGDNGNNDLVPQILAEMQGVGTSNTNSVIVVIAATNKPWAIDSAFLRPGRFDEKIYVPLPDFAARKQLFTLKLKNVPQSGLDYEYLAQITDGFNGADIGAFCDKLKMFAINKSIAAKADCPITMTEVQQVRKTIKSSVARDEVAHLLAFSEQYR